MIGGFCYQDATDGKRIMRQHSECYLCIGTSQATATKAPQTAMFVRVSIRQLHCLGTQFVQGLCFGRPHSRATRRAALHYLCGLPFALSLDWTLGIGYWTFLPAPHAGNGRTLSILTSLAGGLAWIQLHPGRALRAIPLMCYFSSLCPLSCGLVDCLAGSGFCRWRTGIARK